MDQLVFEQGEASRAALESHTRAILAELASPAGAAELKAAGFSPELAPGEVTYGFKTKQSGLLGVGETVVISVAASHVIVPVAKKVLLDLWKVIILPKIKRRFGDDALGKERPAKKATGARAKKAENNDKPTRAAADMVAAEAQTAKPRRTRKARAPKTA